LVTTFKCSQLVKDLMFKSTLMTDFETHPRGTTTEIKLSRALAQEIDQVTRQYGNVVPENVLNAFLRLKEHYALQQQSELL